MKEEIGITLVSLVITIILLIVLAGVSINATLGEDGIITKTKEARENMEKAQIEEQTKLNELYTQMVTELGTSIPSEGTTGGIDTSGATATEDKILQDYTAYVDGELVVGTMKNNGELSATLDAGESYTIPEGYTSGGTITAKDSTNTSTIYDLGVGTSFDVSSYDGYENFTIDDFICEYSVANTMYTMAKDGTNNISNPEYVRAYAKIQLVKSYEDGVLTAYYIIACMLLQLRKMDMLEVRKM